MYFTQGIPDGVVPFHLGDLLDDPSNGVVWLEGELFVSTGAFSLAGINGLKQTAYMSLPA